ncbi:Acetyltransferase (GNAT) family protein [Loktanella sp. DSM 29012]|uniref:GNAT family N-acetyltransferase n=1 Tax=Loktanella sp. DSM 29012 TaxID=1881056 RepID=UPI0008D7B1CC|nr:GNAT family N-acetyltransferase [Loktanella sp. DSM 29012]SEQ67841.1 Acetyltransferase (GNAT) family protein [Loktanella sp. DSM 29012]
MAAAATSDFDIRVVTPADIPDLVVMSDALGAFHGDDSHACPDALTRDLFGTPPWLWGLIVRRGLNLHHIFVVPDLRGRGLGRAIITAVEEHARGLDCAYVSIGTDPDNTGAQAAYEAMGYARRNPGPAFRKVLNPA